MLPTAPSRRFTVAHADYPFAEHWLAYGDGRMHYVDEGAGQPVLLLHGNQVATHH
jgi:hypothetical protein